MLTMLAAAADSTSSFVILTVVAGVLAVLLIGAIVFTVVGLRKRRGR